MAFPVPPKEPLAWEPTVYVGSRLRVGWDVVEIHSYGRDSRTTTTSRYATYRNLSVAKREAIRLILDRQCIHFDETRYTEHVHKIGQCFDTLPSLTDINMRNGDFPDYWCVKIRPRYL